ncbi:hypothetical protein [Psychromonas sp. MME2]|uniref:hypothetical protein n=1 Tax=unclassified Psychromonas TaxID=2614957 RepID=UPI00339C69FE
MTKIKRTVTIFLSLLIIGCGAEEPKQVIIPDVQLDALQKAKNLQNDLQKMQRQQQAKLTEQGL